MRVVTKAVRTCVSTPDAQVGVVVEAGEERLVRNAHVPAPVEELLAQGVVQNEVHEVPVDGDVDGAFGEFDSSRRLTRRAPSVLVGSASGYT